MAGVTKVTTGLTGLAVSPGPHRILGVLYGKIIRALKEMPDSAAYRQHTEKVINERSAVLKQTTDPAEIERLIGCGQVEELIVQAENELNLARKMLTWKPWEPLISQPPKGQWDWPPKN